MRPAAQWERRARVFNARDGRDAPRARIRPGDFRIVDSCEYVDKCRATAWPKPESAPQQDARLARGHALGKLPHEPLPRALGEGAVAEAPLTEADLQERVGHLEIGRASCRERV